MIEIHIECERCHRRWKAGEEDASQLWQLWVVRQIVEHVKQPMAHIGDNCLPEGPSVQWCRPCMEFLGLLPHRDPIPKPSDPPPSFGTPQQRLIELLEEIITEQVDKVCLE